MRDGHPRPVLRGRVVRQRDADLREDIHDEARAVEAPRACPAVDVGDAQVLHRDADDSAVLRRRRRVGVGRVDDGARARVQDSRAGCREPRARLGGKLSLLRLFGGPDLGDLALDRGQQLSPLAELTLDRRLLGRTLGDEPRLLDVRLLETRSPLLDRRPVDLDLPQDLGALVREPVCRVDPRDHLVDRARAQQHLEARVLVTGCVHLDEAVGEHLLGTRQIPAREPELELVLTQVALDACELLVGEVVRVDRPLEVRIEPLDLSEDALRLRLLRRDRWRGVRGRGDQ